MNEKERSIFFRDLPLDKMIEKQDRPKDVARQFFLELLDNYAFESVLDVGCAIGALTYQIHNRYNVPCTGFDFNVEAIKEARRRYADIKFEVLDVEDMFKHYEPGQFDLILTAGVLMHCGQRLFQETCSDIINLKPKLIVHQEIQGQEGLVQERPEDKYLMRSHDYLGYYRRCGIVQPHSMYIMHMKGEMFRMSQIAVEMG